MTIFDGLRHRWVRPQRLAKPRASRESRGPEAQGGRELFGGGGGGRDGWSAFVLKRRCREGTESLNKAGSHQNMVI